MIWATRLSACILVMSCGLVFGGCRPTGFGPTQPSGYRVLLPEASQTQRLYPLVLTVRVMDSQGLPVDDVTVQFRVPAPWATVAEVDPPVVSTRNGQASTTFRARTAGQMAVEIAVEDHADTVAIAVLGQSPRF